MSALYAVFRRELALAWSAGGGAIAPVGFFLGATTLLPLAIGADHELLRKAGPPLVWVAAALAALMTLERLFQADLEDGSLEQLFLCAAPLELIVLAKGAALWLAVGVPLALAGAPAAIALQAPTALIPLTVASLAVGMAGFIGVGLVGAAVSAGVRRGGVLIALIVLPFFAPLLIFGAGVADEVQAGGPFFLLSGCALGAVGLGPILAAAALRIQAG
ncbi:MAG TPA: heme exporter protein CcmB [Caulobacterales bacterium]|nr:heme exporter protein CcmB [Caulobacterales bacterium]